MKKPYKTYHVFTNNQDEWFDTLKEANICYQSWRKEYGCARLYKELRDEEDEIVDEFCLKSFGEYPL